MKLIINERSSFIISNESSDINIDTEQGLYDADTRYLNQHQLYINDHKLITLTGKQVDYYSSVHYLTNPALKELPEGSLGVSVKRFVGNGLHEDLDIKNYSRRTVKFELRLDLNTDFADIFEVRSGKIRSKLSVERFFDKNLKAFRLLHEAKDFYRETRVYTTTLADIYHNSFKFQLTLNPGEQHHTCLDFLVLTSPKKELKTRFSCSSFGVIKTEAQKHLEQEFASLETNYFPLKQAYDQSINDLTALRLAGEKEAPEEAAPAAGIPWFLTYFGRDSLVTALQTVLLAPNIAKAVLYILAKYQGKKVVRFTEEEPGKIFHEIRYGRLAISKDVPFARYYGTIDATPLFIILLHDYYFWSKDEQTLNELREPLKKALLWLKRYGDPDSDGYIEYKRKGHKGLINHGWKDSHDGVAYASGRIPLAPIALCEVQGYVFDAKRKASRLLQLFGDKIEAVRLEKEAELLKKKFVADFWLADEQYFALALDKEKNKVDAITSNPGHLLWSGLLDEEKAKAVADRLLSSEFFTGWGIRTLSSKAVFYNPLSYHNGSVWPHDNSIIAAGLFRYGFFDHFHQVFNGLIQASQYFPQHRLPELFCGFDRRVSIVPVQYITSNAPQAWSAGAIPFMFSTMLGISCEETDLNQQPTIIIKPHLLPAIKWLTVKNLSLFGQKVDLHLEKRGEEVKVEVLNNPDLNIKI